MRLIDADALMQDAIAHSYPLTNAFSVGGVDDGMFVKGIQQVVDEQPTVDAVPVDFINQKIVELQSCAYQHFNDGHEILATCVWETIRLLGSFLKEWGRKEQADVDNCK